MTGRSSRVGGEYWENMLEAACRHYRLHEQAEITKTPEPMKPLGRPNSRGQFLACYTKQAQPDYKGFIKGGRMVMFEAKFTSTERLNQSCVGREQSEYLDRCQRLGARCFVLAGFATGEVYRIPWPVWTDMKAHFGRKYVTEADLREYHVHMAWNATLMLLDE